MLRFSVVILLNSTSVCSRQIGRLIMALSAIQLVDFLVNQEDKRAGET